MNAGILSSKFPLFICLTSLQLICIFLMTSPTAEGLLGGSPVVSGNVTAASYTTGITFKGDTAFDLTFKTENGLSYKNSFSVTNDKTGKITSIKNETAGRSIAISY